MKTSILVAAESRILRDLLRDRLAAIPEYLVVAEAATETEAIARAAENRPQLMILAFGQRAGAGLDVIRRARIQGLATRFVVLSTGHGRPDVQEALRAGASGYLDSNASSDELVEALRNAIGGRFFFSRDVTSDLARVVCRPEEAGQSGLAALTSREQEVLRLIAEGFSNREIAERLHISRRTVDGHRSKLMEKLDLHKASGLVRFAIREGLVAP